MSSFANEIRALITTHKLPEPRLIEDKAQGAYHGIVTFAVGTLLLRGLMDRGESFVDIGTSRDPGRLYQHHDVAIALGWRTVEEVLALRQPDPLDVVMSQIASHYGAIEALFAGPLPSPSLEAARAARQEALERQLEGLRPDTDHRG